MAYEKSLNLSSNVSLSINILFGYIFLWQIENSCKCETALNNWNVNNFINIIGIFLFLSLYIPITYYKFIGK